MREKQGHAWLALAATGSLILGCHRANVSSPSLQKDPLLESRKPIELQGNLVTYKQLTHNEPAPPDVPKTIPSRTMMVQDRSLSAPTTSPEFPPQEQRNSAPFLTTQRRVTYQRGPLPTIPAIRSSTELPADAGTLALRHQVPGLYGHTPDYSWLQGTVDRHFQGYINIRYGDPADKDVWDGKVQLDPDPRLAQFQNGDVVGLEGEILRENGRILMGGGNLHPRYRIRDIWLIRRAGTSEGIP